jgi:hypothetical protein
MKRSTLDGRMMKMKYKNITCDADTPKPMNLAMEPRMEPSLNLETYGSKSGTAIFLVTLSYIRDAPSVIGSCSHIKIMMAAW